MASENRCALQSRKKYYFSKQNLTKLVIGLFYRHKKTFWYQFCNFKHFVKAENSESSLASSCEEFCTGFHVTQYETGLLLELHVALRRLAFSSEGGSQIYKKSASIKLRPPYFGNKKFMTPSSTVHLCFPPKQAKIQSVFFKKKNKHTICMVIL